MRALEGRPVIVITETYSKREFKLLAKGIEVRVNGRTIPAESFEQAEEIVARERNAQRTVDKAEPDYADYRDQTGVL